MEAEDATDDVTQACHNSELGQVYRALSPIKVLEHPDINRRMPPKQKLCQCSKGIASFLHRQPAVQSREGPPPDAECYVYVGLLDGRLCKKNTSAMCRSAGHT